MRQIGGYGPDHLGSGWEGFDAILRQAVQEFVEHEELTCKVIVPFPRAGASLKEHHHDHQEG